MDMDNVATILTRLQPLDFGVWCEFERKGCVIHHANVAILKVTLEKEWVHMSLDLLQSTCKAFRSMIEAVMEANGGRVEN